MLLFLLVPAFGASEAARPEITRAGGRGGRCCLCCCACASAEGDDDASPSPLSSPTDKKARARLVHSSLLADHSRAHPNPPKFVGSLDLRPSPAGLSHPRPPPSDKKAPRHRPHERAGMAQRDKKEEPTELRAPEITLCANSCGFPGNPATQNLCQSCFAAATASSMSPASPSSSSASAAPAAASQPRPALPVEVASPAAAPAAVAAAAPAQEAARAPANRCSSCRKRVGLTGFRCRCGELFCGAHRYSDRHGCSYDYKGAARDAIARENPVVRASKIVRF